MPFTMSHVSIKNNRAVTTGFVVTRLYRYPWSHLFHAHGLQLFAAITEDPACLIVDRDDSFLAMPEYGFLCVRCFFLAR